MAASHITPPLALASLAEPARSPASAGTTFPTRIDWGWFYLSTILDDFSDNGSSYLAGELADWIEDHVRGAPYHPMTQGKIERWHQTLKNRILLEHYYLPRGPQGAYCLNYSDDGHIRSIIVSMGKEI